MAVSLSHWKAQGFSSLFNEVLKCTADKKKLAIEHGK